MKYYRAIASFSIKEHMKKKYLKQYINQHKAMASFSIRTFRVAFVLLLPEEITFPSSTITHLAPERDLAMIWP
jgi:hypothetical protein